jgi:glutathione S-transferase
MLELIGHPFSSYTWKALIPLYEKAIPFTFRVTGPDQPETMALLARHWPLMKFPVLIDDGVPVIESSIIVEYVDAMSDTGPRLVPADAAAAREVRFMDRVFDNHVMNVMQVAVDEAIHNPDAQDQTRLSRMRTALDTIYDWLDVRLAGRTWACGDAFTLADCAAAPSLFYADWVHRIGPDRPALAAYRARLLALPSVARCVDDARPFRPWFPLGAPDRD